MNGHLLFLCGLCRGGKSTIARQWENFEIDIKNNHIYKRCYDCNNKLSCENPRVVICADNIRLALHGNRFLAKAEPMVHTIKNIMINTFLIQGYNVLVDGTHTTESSIRELLRIDSSADFLLVDTPSEICVLRAINTQQENLLPIIERMKKQLAQWKSDPITFINSLRTPKC